MTTATLAHPATAADYEEAIDIGRAYDDTFSVCIIYKGSDLLLLEGMDAEREENLD